jgi:hypothetical protein
MIFSMNVSLERLKRRWRYTKRSLDHHLVLMIVPRHK